MTAIAWIRREMREYDNRAILEASKNHDVVIPVYVVDEEYFETANPGYPRTKFWRDSLRELREIINSQSEKQLVIRRGKPVEQLKDLVREAEIEEVYRPADYTPYSRERDQKATKEIDAEFNEVKDVAMFHRREILTNKGDPYSVYSYYRNKWFDREKPRPAEPENYCTTDLESEKIPTLKELGIEKPDYLEKEWQGGRSTGRERLENFMKQIGDYDERRDLAADDGTSRLSPHLKFGTVSIREAFWEAERAKARGQNEEGVKTWQEELAWRDFYFQMLWNHPETVDEPFLDQYSSLEWDGKDEHEEKWQRWVEGRTGFPFVDAGMRQLRATGWMHNRLRMVVTSFASKDLWLEWRDVHDYFNHTFVDAEISAMIGGIQWAYSIGTDAQPYFRVFNPVTQGERYDEKGEYIRRWVPELEEVPDKHIHTPWKMSEDEQNQSNCIIGKDYPERIVDHSSRREEAIRRFEQAKDS